MKDDRLYLIHIQECGARVIEYTRQGKSFFLTDPKTQDAVIRNLQIMAESSRRLSDLFKSQHPEVDWRSLWGFRNVLVHDYLGVDVERVWEIVENQLPTLNRQVEEMLGPLDAG